jgi:N-acetylmuramoyl-L-alanine amidase
MPGPTDPVWEGATAANFRPGRPLGFSPEAIVIHIMDGTLAGTDAWFNDAHSQVSAHYGVGKAGEVHAYVKETDTAFHAGTVDRANWKGLKAGVNPNFYTVGIEHEGLSAGTYPWADAQLAASVALVRQIAARWDIPLDRDHIVPHHQIRAGKTCPGVNFDLDDYVRRLAAAPAPPQPPATAADFTVKAMTTLRVRSAPTTAASIVRLLSRGDSWTVTGTVAGGEEVEGNALWYAGAASEFIWAGGTDHPNGA